MLKMYLLPFVFFGSLLLSGCLKLVSDQFPEMNPVPTVNAFLREGDTLKLNLSLAGTIDTSDIENIDNAQIKLIINGEFSETMSYSNAGNYTSNVIVKEGNEYTCEVSIPGYDVVKCSQFVPNKTPILNIEHIDTAGFDEEGSPYAAFELKFPNDLASENFYELVLYTLSKRRDNSTYTSYWTSWMIQIEDPVFLNEGIEIPIFSDELLRDSTYTIHYNYYRKYNSTKCGDDGCVVYSQPEIVELRSVSKEYYRYKKQLKLYEIGRYSGFDGSLSVFPLYSNIENGYGIFASYSFSRTDTIVSSYVK